jgi:hypothetical protein
MCGIFGVWGHQRAAALTHLGLYSLQHRGQESAGIVAIGTDGVGRAVRKMGLVSEGFAANDVANLQGSVAIGHTRYSTAGSSTLDNAHRSARFREATSRSRITQPRERRRTAPGHRGSRLDLFVVDGLGNCFNCTCAFVID